jgi:hypothetical protein
VALRGTGDETRDEGAVQLEMSQSSLEAGGGRLTIGSGFEAWRHREALSVQEAGWPRLSLRSEYVESTNHAEETEGNWLRQRAAVRQPFFGGTFEPELTVGRERRRQAALDTDSLTEDAFSILEVRPGFSFRRGALTTTSRVEYQTERRAVHGAFREASHGWTVESEATYDPDAPYRGSVRGGYRVRRVTDFFRLNRQREDTESLLLRVEGQARPLDRAVQIKTFYDALTKRTPVLQETYIRTGPNLGQYVWRDANEDGVQQIDEFVPETTPNEGTYVQRFVPSDSLESVIDLQARTRLSLEPARLWDDPAAWWKRALSQVSTRTTAEVQEKSREEDVAQIYALNLRRFRQPGPTLSGELRLEQEVELFRRTTAYGLEGGWRQVRGLNDRAAGAEFAFLNQWEAEGRLRPADRWAVRLRGLHEVDRTRSEAFEESRSFDIRTLEARPSVTYQPVRSVILTLTGSYAQKRDRRQGRRARVFKVPLEVEWSRAGRLRLTGNYEIANVNLTGDAVGLAQFQLTDGRGAGTSMLWGLQGRYVITNNLRASVSYDGRAPANAPVIHTVRAKLSATF